MPDSGTCDPCGGACQGDTPYCIADERRCGECGPNLPCSAGLNCDLMSYTCVERAANGTCLSDTDCPDGNLCFNGECVACFQDTDCPARNVCDLNTFTCQYSACAGVECQRGSSCDSQTGLCTPGCTTNMDCALPEEMGCNTTSGQCYFLDGRCEFGGDGVCPPGSQCVPSPFAALDPTAAPACTCVIDLVECHPGLMCNDIGALLETIGFDSAELGLEFDATCGMPIF